MAEEKEAKEGKEGAKEPAEGAAKKKGGKKMIIIIVAVVLLIAAAGGAFLFMGKKEPSSEDEAAHDEAAHEEEHATENVDLDTFIVNLSENATFLKTTIVLEVNSHLLHGESKKAAAAEGDGHGGGGGGGLPGVLGEKQAAIKDRIIKILSSKKARQLLVPEGKDQLKEEIADGLKQVVQLDEELVTNVYFVGFIIQ